MTLALVCLSCTTDATRRGYLRTIAESYGPPPRPVIVVPGFGVTRLYDPVTRQYVWGTPRATVHTKYADDLDLPAGGGHDRLVPQGYVGSRGPVNIGWQLMEGLRKFGRYTPERDVFPFYYDWRLSARENAVKLGQLADHIRGGEKVDIVAHSAGAIVALTYVKLAGGANAVDHLILIAPTQRGAIDAFRIFVRPERFIRRVFAPDMVATWPFVFELLPEDGRFLVDENGRAIDRDFWNPAAWRGIATINPQLLKDARKLRDELRESVPSPSGEGAPERQIRGSSPGASRHPPGEKAQTSVYISIIAGDCAATARRVLMRSDGSFAFYPDELRPHEQNLRPMLFEPGDGTVPISSATDGDDAFIVCDGHQGIASDPTVHRAMIRTLRTER